MKKECVNQILEKLGKERSFVVKEDALYHRVIVDDITPDLSVIYLQLYCRKNALVNAREFKQLHLERWGFIKEGKVYIDDIGAFHYKPDCCNVSSCEFLSEMYDEYKSHLENYIYNKIIETEVEDIKKIPLYVNNQIVEIASRKHILPKDINISDIRESSLYNASNFYDKNYFISYFMGEYQSFKEIIENGKYDGFERDYFIFRKTLEKKIMEVKDCFMTEEGNEECKVIIFGDKVYTYGIETLYKKICQKDLEGKVIRIQLGKFRIF